MRAPHKHMPSFSFELQRLCRVGDLSEKLCFQRFTPGNPTSTVDILRQPWGELTNLATGVSVL